VRRIIARARATSPLRVSVPKGRFVCIIFAGACMTLQSAVVPTRARILRARVEARAKEEEFNF
jgi:hypothetical protein